jgi:hypothetical protein
MIPSLFAALLTAHAAAPGPKTPGPWQMEKQEIGCRVSRDEPDGVTLGFETYLTGSSTTLLVSAPKTMLPGDGPGSIRLGLAPGQAVTVNYGAFAVADPGFALLKIFPDRAVLASIASAETLEIGPSIRVPAKGVDAALKGLGDCTAGLLTGWGVDPQLWRDGKVAGYRGSPQSWFTNDDARTLLPRGVASGTLSLLMTTAPDGSASGCKAVVSSDPRLDAPTCAIAKRRGRFRAPLDEGGKPMASYVIVPVRWTRP